MSKEYKELREKVQAYLNGLLSVDDLRDWSLERMKELLEGPDTAPLAGAVLGGIWSMQDGAMAEAQLRGDLRQELAERVRPGASRTRRVSRLPGAAP